MSNQPTDNIFEACGVSKGFSLVVTNQETHKTSEVNFPLPFAVIGRGPEADLSLNDKSVSWRHAYLQMIGGQMLCVDLQSRTGVYWNERAEKSSWLDANQSIRIGPFLIKLNHYSRSGKPGLNKDTNLLLTRSSDEDNLPRVSLDFGKADCPEKRSSQSWHLDRVLTFIGQSPECKIRFSDPGVSTFHCSLLRTHKGIWAIDLLSRSGIFVNGKRVRWAELKDKDELRVGNLLIRFHYENKPPTPRPARPSHGSSGPSSSQIILGRHASSHPATPSPVARVMEPPPQPQANHQGLTPFSLQVPGGTGPELHADADHAAEEYMQSFGSSPFGTHADFWKSIISPLFQQFSLMHHHMFDQFQKTLVMVVQILNAQQKSQFELIRDELDRLQKLNGDLVTLQAELNRQVTTSRAQPAGSASTASQPSGPAKNETAAPAAPPRPRKPGALPFHKGAVPPNHPKAGSSTQNPQGTGFPDGLPLSDIFSVSPDDLLQELDEEAGPANTTAEHESPKAKKKPTASAENGEDLQQPPPEEVHRFINERLKAIQEERQSLWQSILKKLMG